MKRNHRDTESTENLLELKLIQSFCMLQKYLIKIIISRSMKQISVTSPDTSGRAVSLW